MTESPSWYQLLGVPRDATPAQIKAAWRDATDRFEPGSGTGQFALFNQAADVLLDPDRRAAYDATLEPDADEPSAVAPPPPPLPPGMGSAPPVTEPEPAFDESAVDDERAADDRGVSGSSWLPSARVPGWLLAVLALAAVGALVVAGVLFAQNRELEQSAEAGDQAVEAAERALPQVLSYDYRHLEADRDRAVRFLSDDYRKEYTATFEKLVADDGATTGGAKQTSAVVKATVVNTAVAESTPDRARIVVFLNQATRKADQDPTFSLNRLAVTMVRSDGDREWLVDQVDSY